MKNLNQIAVSVLAAAAVFGLAASFGTSAAAYDSSEDPIVSVSYLYNIFKTEIMNEVANQINTAVESRLTGFDPTQSPDEKFWYETEEPAVSPIAAEYDVVELREGEILYAEGACDVMLRSGSAVCVAPDLKQGIADYTNGVEIYAGEPLVKNHMCLIPRGDGRGVLASSESVYIMVRGEYSIVEGY